VDVAVPRARLAVDHGSVRPSSTGEPHPPLPEA
jgi:hypothetical protein